MQYLKVTILLALTATTVTAALAAEPNDLEARQYPPPPTEGPRNTPIPPGPAVPISTRPGGPAPDSSPTKLKARETARKEPTGQPGGPGPNPTTPPKLKARQPVVAMPAIQARQRGEGNGREGGSAEPPEAKLKARQSEIQARQENVSPPQLEARQENVRPLRRRL